MKLISTMSAVLVLGSATFTFAGQSYIVVDNQTGMILASQRPNDKLQVASLTKIATAMVTLDWAQLSKADLSQMAIISPRAVRAGGINPVGLAGGRLPQSARSSLHRADGFGQRGRDGSRRIRWRSRLPNNNGLAPISNFVSHMNALAHTLGMKRTLFLNPSGSDNVEGTLPYSTASDMARLTRYAYSEADFPFFVSQKSRTIHVFRGGVDMPVELRNTNELLDRDGIDGVKTGRTGRAGDCLILSSERRPEVQRQGEAVYITPRRIIIVLLGSQDRFGEGIALARQGWGLYDQWTAAGRQIKKNEAL